MDADSRSFIRYAGLRSCLRGVAIVALLTPFTARNVWAQPAPGGDGNVLDEGADQDGPDTDDDSDPEAAPRPLPLPRKAKKRVPAPKPPLQSRERVAQDEEDAPPEPGAVRLHLETPVPAALYDVGTGPVPAGKEPPDSKLVCHAPCDVEVDVSRRQVFSVWAPSMEMSKPFTLREDTPTAVVTFEPAPSTVNDVGTVIGSIGVGLIVAGATAFAYAADEGNLDDSALLGCGVTVGAGSVFVLIGLPMLLATRTPEVTVEQQPQGDAFAIDRRPKAIAPRPWLGEF
jgi:hypothetical protein